MKTFKLSAASVAIVAAMSLPTTAFSAVANDANDAVTDAQTVNQTETKDSQNNLVAKGDIEVIEVKGELIPQPISETANSLSILSMEAINKAGASHFQDVMQQLGNVNFSAGASRGRFIQIRGIGERSQFVDPINPSVGLAIDGIDYSEIGNAAGMFDISQVEVFKGPQGTNIGANALAGFVNIIGVQPDAAAPNRLRVESGNYGLLNLGVAMGAEFSNSATGRVAISKNTSDGYIHNHRVDSTEGRDDTNNIDELGVRGLLNVKFDRDLDAQFILHYFDINNGYDAFSLDQNRTTLSDEPGVDEQETQAAAVKANYRGLDLADVLVFASHSDSDMTYGYDEDWSHVGLHPYEYSSTDYYFRQRTANQLDVRFTDKDQKWVAGVYFQNKTVDLTREYTWLESDFYSQYEQTNVAAYGEIRHSLSKDLKLSAGIRIENNKGDYFDSNNVNKDTSDTMVGGHLTASHQRSKNSLVYTRLSRGFKSGGVNGEALGRLGEPGLERFYDALRENGSFKPEVLNNVELGYRYNNREAGLNANLVLFYSARSDMQVKQWFTNEQEVQQGDAPPVFVGYLSNAPTGNNYGVEANMTAELSDTLKLNFGYSLLETEVDNMYRLEANPETFEDERVSIDGREQAHAPGYQYQVGVDWQITDRLNLNVSNIGKDSFYYSYSHDQKSEAYSLLNMSLTYQGDAYDLTFWARNMTDEDYGVRGFYFGNDPRADYAPRLYEQFGEPSVFGLRFELLF